MDTCVCVCLFMYLVYHMHTSPASRRGQDKRGFCRSAAIYHNYAMIMA